jgi:ribosomal protein S5
MKVTHGTRSISGLLQSLLGLSAVVLTSAMIPVMTSCSTLQVVGNEDGSEPNNEIEQREYMKAIRRCHKMGGSRIVKVQGELRCF